MVLSELMLKTNCFLEQILRCFQLPYVECHEQQLTVGEYFTGFCIVYKYTAPSQRISRENYFPYLNSQTNEYYFQKLFFENCF